MVKLNDELTKVVAAAFLVASPNFINGQLSAKDKHYAQLVNELECARTACGADFNGDGLPGRIERTPATNPHSDRWLVISAGEQELLRLPYNQVDESLRTHVAVRNDAEGTRVPVFDGTRKPNSITKAVYKHDGQKMVQVEAVEADHELLSAMASRDLAGTAYCWMLYDFLGQPLMIAYYALLIGGFVGIAINRKKCGRTSTFS